VNLQAVSFEPDDINLLHFGPKINTGLGDLQTITCTKFGDPRFGRFALTEWND